MIYSYHSILNAIVQETSYGYWRKYKKNPTRKELNPKQLGELVDASQVYVCAYEIGRHNPKSKSPEAMANALTVNIEVLTNSDFNGIKAIYRLF